ncbi:Pentatricopeptide repeat-containing protein [Seminavis robusta]|uniref:Pentatricopeptide repeat-containing protein n=1 Tax=Seminavis robusta TaxID=568900 RepID=A0A9N8DIQ8_9STRA|nr:Pentatricopeptide repeat-containing protein [Seminavis robusta]|eukprot:Sro83_g044570.1 Pentatricopeptide repeat-containing protein (882) ;mRNA; f:116897-119638
MRASTRLSLLLLAALQLGLEAFPSLVLPTRQGTLSSIIGKEHHLAEKPHNRSTKKSLFSKNFSQLGQPGDITADSSSSSSSASIKNHWRKPKLQVLQVTRNGFQDSTISGRNDETSSMLQYQSNGSSHDENRITFKTLTLQEYEEKEKQEMEWMIETTSKVLGLDVLGDPSRLQVVSNTTAATLMSKDLTRRAYKLMRAWAKRDSDQAPHVVELIMKRLISEFAMGNPNVYITTKTYNLLLDAWSNSSDKGAPERSETILGEMENQCDNGNGKVRPNARSYNHVMSCYANHWKGRCHSKVRDIFDRMMNRNHQAEEAHEGDDDDTDSTTISDVQPNRKSYNLLLYAIACSNSLADAGEQAEAVLRMMQRQHAASVYDEENTLMMVGPDVHSYNLVLRAWSKTRRQGRDDTEHYWKQKMQQIFQELLDDKDILPNTDTFNHMLAAHLKSATPNSLQQFDATLKQMEESYAAGNDLAKPDRVTVNTVVVAYAKSGLKHGLDRALVISDRMETQYNIQPDTFGNNILIDCWNKCGRTDAAEFAISTLDKMERNYRDGQLEQKPDTVTFCTVIDCIAKSGDDESGEKADMVLERMRDLHKTCGGDPANNSVYNSAINAWAASDKSRQAMNRALELLAEMEKMHSVDEFVPAPTTVSYNSVMKVLGRGGNKGARLCAEILAKLEQNELEETSDVIADAFTYTACITAFARSDLRDKAERAYMVLQRMLAAYEAGNQRARPNIRPFNSALNACAHVDPEGEQACNAFVIMVAILNLLSLKKVKGVEPNHTTYGMVLRAVSILLPHKDSRRKDLVERVFRKASKEGQVGHLVLNQMKFAASSEVYQSLLGCDKNHKLSVKDLPASWTANVHEESKTRQRKNPIDDNTS